LSQDRGGDRTIRLVERFAGCFQDYRAPDLIEHTVSTLVGQRVFGLALGYEDLIDHDELRHDRSWRSWPASSKRGVRIARRWPANRRSTGWR
jgi:Transposase DDE domain group 1